MDSLQIEVALWLVKCHGIELSVCCTILTATRGIWKCWAHSPLRAAARRIAIHQVSRRTPPAHRCPQQRRQRVTGDRYGPIEMGPINSAVSIVRRGQMWCSAQMWKLQELTLDWPSTWRSWTTIHMDSAWSSSTPRSLTVVSENRMLVPATFNTSSDVDTSVLMLFWIPPPTESEFRTSFFDTVGWVFWPIKPVPYMTYNVFGGTLNLAQFN